MQSIGSMLKRSLCVGVVLSLLVSLGSFAVAQTCVQPPEGLVSWWPGEGHADDIQGANHGTLQNDATFAPGKVGHAFSLDGSDDVVLVLESRSMLDSFFQLTLDAWIQPVVVSGSQGVVTKYDSRTPGDSSCWLEVEEGKLRMGVCQACGLGASPAVGAIFQIKQRGHSCREFHPCGRGMEGWRPV
jgi:hypothetical protein